MYERGVGPKGQYNNNLLPKQTTFEKIVKGAGHQLFRLFRIGRSGSEWEAKNFHTSFQMTMERGDFFLTFMTM